MSRKDDERVADILEASGQVAKIAVAGEAAYKEDPLRQLAIERLLEIIGESARAMTEETRSRHPEVPWSDIVGLRILVAHHYHPVDPGSGLGDRQRERAGIGESTGPPDPDSRR